MPTSVMPHTNEIRCSVTLVVVLNILLHIQRHPPCEPPNRHSRQTYGARRGICVVSADVAGLPRSILCRFGGLSRRSRLSFQR